MASGWDAWLSPVGFALRRDLFEQSASAPRNEHHRRHLSLSGGSGIAPMNTDCRITVMHFASEPVRGGAEEHMLMLLTHLDRARFRPMLAAPPHLIELLRPDLPDDI